MTALSNREEGASLAWTRGKVGAPGGRMGAGEPGSGGRRQQSLRRTRSRRASHSRDLRCCDTAVAAHAK